MINYISPYIQLDADRYHALQHRLIHNKNLKKKLQTYTLPFNDFDLMNKLCSFVYSVDIYRFEEYIRSFLDDYHIKHDDISFTEIIFFLGFSYIYHFSPDSFNSLLVSQKSKTYAVHKYKQKNIKNHFYDTNIFFYGKGNNISHSHYLSEIEINYPYALNYYIYQIVVEDSEENVLNHLDNNTEIHINEKLKKFYGKFKHNIIQAQYCPVSEYSSTQLRQLLPLIRMMRFDQISYPIENNKILVLFLHKVSNELQVDYEINEKVAMLHFIQDIVS